MAKMSSALLIFALCIASGTAALQWTKLHLTYGFRGGFTNIPLTLVELLKEDYSLMVHDSELNVDFYAYKEDPRVSIGFDTYGNIAAVRTSYIKADLATKAVANGVEFDFDYYYSKPHYSNATYYGLDVYYNTVLFTRPDVLLKGGRPGTASLLGDNVYVRVQGIWTKVPRKERHAQRQGFTKEACFPMMGKHYFYGVNPSMDCKDWIGLFGGYENGELIEAGFTIFGAHTDDAPRTGRTWFESPDSAVYRTIVPYNRPDCLLTEIDAVGSTSLHMFFKEDPQDTYC